MESSHQKPILNEHDEREPEARKREAQEGRRAKDLAALSGTYRAAVYRRVIQTDANLTDAEYRFLCVLTTKFGRALENCFPSRQLILKSLGGPTRKVKRLDQIRAACERKGFLRRVPLVYDAVGALLEAPSGGRFISAVGYQFLLPAGMVQDAAWEGPRVWSNRLYAQRSKRAHRSH